MKSIRDYLELSEANMPMGRQVAKASPVGGDSGLAGSLASMGAAGGAGAALKKSVQTLAPAAKVIPGAMSAMSVHDAWERYKEGDNSGAVISVLAAAGYLVPGPMGWTLGGAADAVNLGRDIGSGKFDPLAQAAKDLVNEEKKIMNNAEHIAALRQKLSRIEEAGITSVGRKVAQHAGTDMVHVPGLGRTEKYMGNLPHTPVSQQALPGPQVSGGALTPSVSAAGPQVSGGALTPSVSAAGPQVSGGALTPSVSAAGPRVKDMGKLDAIEVQPRQLPNASSTPARPGQAGAAASKGSNAARTAAGAAAIGAAGTAGYLATQGGGANTPGQGGRPGGIAANPSTTAAGGLTPEEEQELALLADKLGKHMGRNPDVDKLLLRHTKLRGNQPTPPL